MLTTILNYAMEGCFGLTTFFLWLQAAIQWSREEQIGALKKGCVVAMPASLLIYIIFDLGAHYGSVN
ncbi:MAG: hypothetical protein AAB473_02470 [Patescibacteria group bacterium]